MMCHMEEQEVLYLLNIKRYNPYNSITSYAKAGVGKTADEMSFSLDAEF